MFTYAKQTLTLCFISFFMINNTCAAQPLRIAVASNFFPLLTQLVPKFTQQTGIQVQIISGATGALFQQIRHGAPYDIFLAADSIRPKKLMEQQLIVTDSLKTYAYGQLALFSAIDRNISLKNLQNKSKSNTRLAIANPNTAPYGLAAKQSLTNLGLWQRYKNNLIIGMNINQTFQQVRSGSVQFGIVAYSQLILNKLNGELLPESSYSPIKQQLVILINSKNIKQAKIFSTFILNDKTQLLISKVGYKKIKTSIIDNVLQTSTP